MRYKVRRGGFFEFQAKLAGLPNFVYVELDDIKTPLLTSAEPSIAAVGDIGVTFDDGGRIVLVPWRRFDTIIFRE